MMHAALLTGRVPNWSIALWATSIPGNTKWTAGPAEAIYANRWYGQLRFHGQCENSI